MSAIPQVFKSRPSLAERYLKLQNDPAKSSAAFKVEFPYDLNSLFTLQDSFETLKQTIEYLA